MVCRVCDDRAACRKRKDCRAHPQVSRIVDPRTLDWISRVFGVDPSALMTFNHAAEDAAPNKGAPRE